jgi:signal transduction histidine kinase
MDELELRLARARALLLANLSHEFRTPLNAVVGFADLMRRELRGPIGRDEYREYVKDIHDSGVHLLGLVDDLLDLAGTEPNRLRLNEEELDLERLVTGVVRLLGVVADQRQVIVSTELHPAVPRLQGDGRRLTQVLLNLLSNALKFTPAGGNVRITSSPSADGGCTLAISDTGVGMSPDTVAKLGQPYPVDTASAQSPKHSGLGLPICRELVEMHGGRLEIKSKVGLGTTVSIHLPRERVIPTAVGCDSI